MVSAQLFNRENGTAHFSIRANTGDKNRRRDCAFSMIELEGLRRLMLKNFSVGLRSIRDRSHIHVKATGFLPRLKMFVSGAVISYGMHRNSSITKC